MCSTYQILVLEDVPGKTLPDVLGKVTRYYLNRTKGEPYITAEISAGDVVEVFIVGAGESESPTTKRRRKRAGIMNIPAGENMKLKYTILLYPQTNKCINNFFQ